jgi:hypothetical protein
MVCFHPLPPGFHGNRLSNRSQLRRRSTNRPHCPNAPDERCQRENTSGMSLPRKTTSLALAIGDRGSVDGDIDHGLSHLRTDGKSRQRTGLPLSRDHRQCVDGGDLRSVRYRHTGTVHFCVADMASARGLRSERRRLPQPQSIGCHRPSVHLRNRVGCSRMHTRILQRKRLTIAVSHTPSLEVSSPT